MDESKTGLSLEQEFNHRIFCDQVEQLSHDQAQELLIELHEQMLRKDNTYKKIFLGQSKDFTDSLFS
ncbi:MAG: NblA/ycf18 family protein [Cyanobacteria bacterium P01_A01_bin.45]